MGRLRRWWAAVAGPGPDLEAARAAGREAARDLGPAVDGLAWNIRSLIDEGEGLSARLTALERDVVAVTEAAGLNRGAVEAIAKDARLAAYNAAQERCEAVEGRLATAEEVLSATVKAVERLRGESVAATSDARRARELAEDMGRAAGRAQAEAEAAGVVAGSADQGVADLAARVDAIERGRIRDLETILATVRVLADRIDEALRGGAEAGAEASAEGTDDGGA
jgi:hypothetical protein